MPILANPASRRVVIPVGDSKVILVLRNYTTKEYTRYLSSQSKPKGKLPLDDNEVDEKWQARIDFIDELLIGIDARDGKGEPDHVAYLNNANDKEEPLTVEVPGWKEYVNASWKIAAALQIEGGLADGEEVLKN